MTIKETFDNFILSRRLAGLSKKSIKNYDDFICPFILHAGESTDFKEINQLVINSYISQMLDKKISKATLATYIRHVKIFLRWSDSEYKGNYSVKAIKVPRTPKKNVHIYSNKEIKVIFESAKSDVPWISARNNAVIALMIDSGLRQSEVCTLQRKNVYVNEHYSGRI